jgi:hypothetical protein
VSSVEFRSSLAFTQGTSHIKPYYATACAAFEGVEITGAVFHNPERSQSGSSRIRGRNRRITQTEIDYISAFIKGREDKPSS